MFPHSLYVNHYTTLHAIFLLCWNSKSNFFIQSIVGIMAWGRGKGVSERGNGPPIGESSSLHMGQQGATST